MVYGSVAERPIAPDFKSGRVIAPPSQVRILSDPPDRLLTAYLYYIDLPSRYKQGMKYNE